MPAAIIPQPLPAHPRLFASAADWERIRQQTTTDAVTKRLFDCLQRQAENFLNDSPVTRTLTGIRLLDTARLCLDRILVLAAAARLTGDTRYVERALAEMRAVADFTDWNPRHFLDTAEVSTAMAIGFDWLHEFMSVDDRDKIATALHEKGLVASLNSPKEYLGWIANANNWNQVCHAGISLAAIALAERYPDLSEGLLKRALENVPRAAPAYAPDGAYVEGPMYWSYGTTYHVVLTDAVRHLTGSSHGLDEFPGFEASAAYMAQMTSPAGLFYNYADSAEQRGFQVPLFWFARRFRNAGLVRFDAAHLDTYLREPGPDKSSECRFITFALIWHDPSLMAADQTDLPLAWHGKGENSVAVFRSAWDDPQAVFVGFKGGSPRLPHAHMDVGSFVLEADGVRWAIELNRPDYHHLESRGIRLWDGAQDGDRWKVFRFGSRAHNLLRFNDADQLVDGHAEFVHFDSRSPNPRGIVDLTPLYRDKVATARRGIALNEDRTVLIQDEWTTGDREVTVEWLMLTRAEISIQENKVELRQGGRSLRLMILAPQRVEIEVRDVSKPHREFDVANPGVAQLVLRTTTRARTAGTFRVLAIPESSQKGKTAPGKAPLVEWL